MPTESRITGDNWGSTLLTDERKKQIIEFCDKLHNLLSNMDTESIKDNLRELAPYLSQLFDQSGNLRYSAIMNSNLNTNDLVKLRVAIEGLNNNGNALINYNIMTDNSNISESLKKAATDLMNDRVNDVFNRLAEQLYHILKSDLLEDERTRDTLKAAYEQILSDYNEIVLGARDNNYTERMERLLGKYQKIEQRFTPFFERFKEEENAVAKEENASKITEEPKTPQNPEPTGTVNFGTTNFGTSKFGTSSSIDSSSSTEDFNLALGNARIPKEQWEQNLEALVRGEASEGLKHYRGEGRKPIPNAEEIAERIKQTMEASANQKQAWSKVEEVLKTEEAKLTGNKQPEAKNPNINAEDKRKHLKEAGKQAGKVFTKPETEQAIPNAAQDNIQLKKPLPKVRGSEINPALANRAGRIGEFKNPQKPTPPPATNQDIAKAREAVRNELSSRLNNKKPTPSAK